MRLNLRLKGGGEAKYSHVKRVPQAFVVYQNNHGFISRDTEYLFNKIDCTYGTVPMMKLHYRYHAILTN